MRRILGLTVAFALSCFVQCVGDPGTAPIPVDAGSDVGSPTDGAVTDAGVDSGEPVPKGDIAWVKTYGTTRDANGVAVDGKGNAYVVGAYVAVSKAVPVGNLNLPITTSPDAYAIKLDPNGNPLWAKTFGGASQDAFIDVAVDTSGDLYVIGFTNSPSITFKGTIASATPASLWGFLTKLSGVDGSPQWEVPIVANQALTTIVTAVGATKVYVGTTFGGTLDAGAGGLLPTKGSVDFAIMEIDMTSHTVGWVKQIGGAGPEAIHDLTVGPKGDIYFAAQFGGAITSTGLGAKAPAQVGTGYNALLAKLAPDGTAVWATAYGDAVNQKETAGYGVAVDRTGTRVALSGNFNGGVDFGMGALGSAGQQDGFLVSVDDNGPKTKWQKTFGGSATDFGTRVAFDPWGNVIATGYYLSTDAKIDGKTLPAIPTTNEIGTYLCKVKVDGTLAWAKGAIPVASDAGLGGGPVPLGLAVSSAGRILLSGKQFKSAADYGDGVVHTFLSPPGVGADDSFIGSWNP